MGDKGDVLEPGAVIKPQMTKEDATALLLRLYGLKYVWSLLSIHIASFHFSFEQTSKNNFDNFVLSH